MCPCNERRDLLIRNVKTCIDKIPFINRFVNESFSRADAFHEGSVLLKHGLSKGLAENTFILLYV